MWYWIFWLYATRLSKISTLSWVACEKDNFAGVFDGRVLFQQIHSLGMEKVIPRVCSETATYLSDRTHHIHPWRYRGYISISSGSKQETAYISTRPQEIWCVQAKTEPLADGSWMLHWPVTCTVGKPQTLKPNLDIKMLGFAQNMCAHQIFGYACKWNTDTTQMLWNVKRFTWR